MTQGRSPCGERGLKCRLDSVVNLVSASLPVRGAWVEILRFFQDFIL